MKEYIKQNLAVILAFLLPIGLIVVVGLTTYIPSHLLSTKYNFIYTSCTNGRDYYSYNCDTYLEKKYSVVNGALTENEVPKNVVNDDDFVNKNSSTGNKLQYNDRIFYHNTEKNESREITLEEAKKLKLSSLLTSPDGVNVSGYYSSGGGGSFLFSGNSSSYGYYLMKGKTKSKLNLINQSDVYYYQNNFQFVGWVLPGRN